MLYRCRTRHTIAEPGGAGPITADDAAKLSAE
jgi:hypothetical protein